MYKSSTIIKSTYNLGTRVLTITFKNGGVYKYEDVNIDDYAFFECSESQGKSMSVIKKYKFEKLDKENVEFLIKEIESITE